MENTQQKNQTNILKLVKYVGVLSFKNKIKKSIFFLNREVIFFLLYK